MLSGEFVNALENCVKSNNYKAFGLLVRSEITTYGLYAPGKDEDLSILLEFIRRNFADQYLRASICEIRDFLAMHRFVERSTNGEIEFPINSICQSFLIASVIEHRNRLTSPRQQLQSTNEGNQVGNSEQYHELPNQRKIIEVRNFWGQLKVFLSWWAIWNTLHQIAWDLCFAVLLCNRLGICTPENKGILIMFRIILSVMTSLGHMNIRMDNKAKRRWVAKYGS